jgi:hypothetical protein
MVSIGVGGSSGYDPKWKKKKTLAEEAGSLRPEDVGISGTVNVLFKQGDTTAATLANPGDPVRDVASAAGQFIKYGCGKGECGTCEALCNGKWIKPCVAVVPGDIPSGGEYTIQLKEVKSKTTSSGKFYSVKSFFMGFYNNLIGMVGFVKDRRAARKNYLERMDYEDDIARLTAEKKAARIAAEAKLNQD